MHVCITVIVSAAALLDYKISLYCLRNLRYDCQTVVTGVMSLKQFTVEGPSKKQPLPRKQAAACRQWFLLKIYAFF